MTGPRSLGLPITLAIVMIVLLIVLTVGWVLLSVFGALESAKLSVLYWVLLPLGATFILLLLVGVVIYLILTIKAINLSRRQSNFIDSVTHELKSPIASMKLYLQTLSRHPVSQQEQSAFYQSMLEDLDRLDRLIDQMLAAGRSESPLPPGQAEEVELSSLLRGCAAAVCMSYRVPVQSVNFDMEPCTVRAPRMDLDVIFRNLLDNAIKYAAAQPQVDVVLRRDAKGNVVVRIADNGRGIPPKMRRKIFGRFVRLGSELEREKRGTGLGLYIVRNLLRRLKGKIRLLDRQSGTGAVFEVTLPAR
jgi:signal transduction histidine kinase